MGRCANRATQAWRRSYGSPLRVLWHIRTLKNVMAVDHYASVALHPAHFGQIGSEAGISDVVLLHHGYCSLNCCQRSLAIVRPLQSCDGSIQGAAHHTLVTTIVGGTVMAAPDVYGCSPAPELHGFRRSGAHHTPPQPAPLGLRVLA